MNSSPPPTRKQKNQHFWRAFRYLWPYRGKVIFSIVAALFVGVANTGSLMTMLPILRVLTNGDTVQAWVYRQTAEQRLGVKLSQDISVVQIVHLDTNGPAAKAGLNTLALINRADAPADAPVSPFPQTTPAYQAGEVLRCIALGQGDSLNLYIHGQSQPIPVHEKRISWYGRIGLKLAAKLPIAPVATVAVIFAAFATLGIAGNGLRYFQEHLADEAAIQAVNDLRRQLYGRVLRVPLEFFGQQGTSDTTSRLVSDADTLQDGFKQVLGQSIQEPIKAVLFLGSALWLSWKLTLLMICFAPLMAVIIGKFGKKMRRASRAALRSNSVMLGQIEGTLQGIRVVKAAHAQRFERQRYGRIMNGLAKEQIHMSHIDALSAPVLETLILLMSGVILMASAWFVFVEHSLTPEQFFGVMVSLGVIVESLRKASKVNVAMQRSNAAAARIFESMDLPMESERAKLAGELQRGRRLAPLKSRIDFRGVTFSYPNAPTPAVCNVDLSVPCGQSVAIVGRNGSGKTTLMALLPRFFDPQAGQILIDGVDIRSGSLASLRRQISVVTQDSVIFPGTIAENIAYGNAMAAPDAPDTPARRELFAKIEDAAHRAFAHEFVLEKPQGYQTHLGELGGQLSGGQKQRLCIARAILRASPILIFDEATSQVDAESEHLIQQAIERLIHLRTTFVIAHRFSTIMSADTVVVMDRGRIVGQGRHEELLRTCETYKQLYERQRLGETG